jgi:hypothetical protein
MRFQGSTNNLMPAPPRCVFPGCPVPARHEHHVTYDPPITKDLCVPHHKQITIINGQQARKYRRGLSTEHRWWIWYQWIEGKLKARRTQKALEYIGEWDKYSPPKAEATTVVATAPEPTKIEPPRPKRKAKRKHKAVKRRSSKHKSKRRKKDVRQSTGRKVNPSRSS